ncbi:hypothetical protein SYNPS1DRAFT_29758 [Syncephalis pseudoplumigaleata]|uniref:Uncharacterized protein n=1 Tax=Syncephalis pseudoplumigaleata TaxID=1712513 RepID=A0A4P9YX54_9FUNG|nr:hypothetical protein SYNPS1DRAFT_29758 [Syncephalis pseudoplumigaleata]|eukprot:RKP24478.1 hypothetical protein SYNPS1DRAFT_29758 [Syncephalis pseudoplumigaleata]
MSQDIAKIPLDNRGDVRFLKHQLSMAVDDSRQELQAAIEKQTKRLDSKHKAMFEKRLQEILDKVHADDEHEGRKERGKEQWQSDIFEMAGASMTVNELEYAVAMEDLVETEAFDRELKNQTIELQNEVEELTLQLVDRRRNLPQQVSKLVGHAFQLEQELLEDKVNVLLEAQGVGSVKKEEEEEEEEEAQEEEEKELLQSLPMDRLQKEYKQVVERMMELAKASTLPGTVQHVERTSGYLKDHLDRLEHPEPEAQLLLTKPSLSADAKESEQDEAESSAAVQDKQAGKSVSLREKSALAEKLRRTRQQEHAPYSRK